MVTHKCIANRVGNNFTFIADNVISIYIVAQWEQLELSGVFKLKSLFITNLGLFLLLPKCFSGNNCWG
jgi:hypothetical protein